ncbi:MAG TPA: tripartite tricarboxylate transporter TctB family protein [Thermohalobaculum sp.]|nr:tripartite tricarboxylate transporter TctB family protein [Thermohalobaculum sp.]
MPRDFWIGLVVLGFAALYRIEAGKIRLSPLDGPVGAPGLPKLLGLALGILAIVMIVRGLIEHFRGRAAPETEPKVEPGEFDASLGLRPHLRAAGILAIGIGYLLLLPVIGYALGIMALILTVSLYIGATLDIRTIAVAVVGGAAFHLLFVEFLGIPLPKGMLLGMLR